MISFVSDEIREATEKSCLLHIVTQQSELFSIRTIFCIFDRCGTADIYSAATDSYVTNYYVRLQVTEVSEYF